MMPLILIALFVMIISWLAVRYLIVYLKRENIVDRPNDRSLHQGEIPRGGGLAIVFLLMVATFLMGVLSDRLVMFGALLIMIFAWSSLSWLDDRINLTASRRFIVQIGLAVLSVFAFGAVEVIQINTSYDLYLPLFGVGLSVVGVVWLANLYNFMDGMDGLAGSQTLIAAATMSFWLWQYGDQGLAIVCLVLSAASYGFLWWNWHPAKIFMGDVGSVTIGAFFATITLIAVSRYNMPVISFALLLGVFVADATITVIRRLFKREKVWQAHRSHYYQRLANLGFNHSKIVIGLIALMVVSSLIASMTVIDPDNLILGVLIEFILLGTCAIGVEYLQLRQNKCQNKSNR